MSFFGRLAPVFGHFGDRWRPETTAMFAGWLRPFVPEGGRLLDLGGGTGALAVHMAEELHCHVTVLDITPEMLAYLPGRADVTGVVGSAERMPFDNDSFDAVMVSDAFHHFRDQDGAVREMQRVVPLRRRRSRPRVRPPPHDAPRGDGREGRSASRAASSRPDEMCAFMAERGIDGECESINATSYRFVGSVR